MRQPEPPWGRCVWCRVIDFRDDMWVIDGDLLCDTCVRKGLHP